MSFADTAPILIAFACALLALSWLSRQISIRTQRVTYFITLSLDFATLAIFLLFLPGIIAHESAHWLMARLVGLKVSKFRVWPKRQGDHIGLGSVNVDRGDAWRESLVGVAPLLLGTLLLALIGAQVFQAERFVTVLDSGQVTGIVGVFFQALGSADGLIWAYLVFTIGNSMMPSQSDREPLKTVLLYLAFFAIVYFVVGLPGDFFGALLAWATPLFAIIVGALIFVLLLDLIVLAFLYPLELLLERRGALQRHDPRK
ncbi:MAG: hypothetical protein IPK16_16920 [Anaerolineales bacterium]|nr:hypothetical protein [Anaerolineales bacterium]